MRTGISGNALYLLLSSGLLGLSARGPAGEKVRPGP